MGIFGRKSQPAAEVAYEPNPDPVFGDLNPMLTAPIPQKKGGLFGGGLGKVLGTVGEAMMYGPYMGQVRQARAENAENRAFKRQLLEEEVEAARLKRSQPSYHTVPGVGLVASYPDGRHETAVAAQDDPAAAPAGIREWEYMQGLPQEQREQFMRFRQPVPFQYTPQGIQAVVETQRLTQPFKGSGGSGDGSNRLRRGQVIDGYTYIGGDPNSPASWRR